MHETDKQRNKKKLKEQKGQNVIIYTCLMKLARVAFSFFFALCLDKSRKVLVIEVV